MIEVVDKPDLKNRTTLKMGGRGRAEVVMNQPSDFDQLPSTMAGLGGMPVVWGQGSNILARDGEHDLILLTLKENERPRILSQDEGGVIIRTGGGMRMAGLLRWCREHGLSGLEPLSGIPGSVGGAVGMNAGSYGREMNDLMTGVQIWSEETGLIWKKQGQWSASYRTLSFPEVAGLYVVTAVDLKLVKKNPEEIQKAIRTTFLKKKSSQPVTSRTCGCVFKNPHEGKPAGWLLERAGFRGKKQGQVGFSEMHANFLINHGQGSSSQALELIESAREMVRNKFEVSLELEVKVYP